MVSCRSLDIIRGVLPCAIPETEIRVHPLPASSRHRNEEDWRPPLASTQPAETKEPFIAKHDISRFSVAELDAVNERGAAKYVRRSPDVRVSGKLVKPNECLLLLQAQAFVLSICLLGAQTQISKICYTDLIEKLRNTALSLDTTDCTVKLDKIQMYSTRVYTREWVIMTRRYLGSITSHANRRATSLTTFSRFNIYHLAWASRVSKD
ncbi:hypothetical protein T310_8162 [Rasamsonia emersonii CBS 393.64]|uniref:Uncharacterized protein n=1 Tax=Rasamsonia emersonii (strain ATCC 16479 / CBS 393.64 / IMI 116815) TaxID=1408163 RepID=A0A0F4YHY3_RASE3|nr:hypothetical protein T310_8162 [Rasamsonia emersonii CBS 393.64]KKA17897.1 hypothetical protein T310_8162 [Rasamsonia emersonii CBS 393.64]